MIELRAAGAVAVGSNWKLSGKTIRVLRTPNQFLDRVAATFERDVAPVVAPDVVVAVGAETRALPKSFARAGTSASIARGSGSIWMSYADAVREFGL